jgi:hypothetical protein
VPPSQGIWAHFFVLGDLQRKSPRTKKPGYPLVSFLPPGGKKGYRFYPLRMGGQ